MKKVLQSLDDFYHNEKVRETAIKAAKGAAKAASVIVISSFFDNKRKRKK